MNVTAMLTVANTPAPSDPGTQPSHGPQGHQAGARTGGVGLGVCPDTTLTPLPCLSLGRHPLSHSGTMGWGTRGGGKSAWPEKEGDGKERAPRESSPEDRPICLSLRNREKERAETSGGVSEKTGDLRQRKH